MVCRFRKAPQHGGDGSRRLTLPLSTFLTAWAFLGLNILSPGPNVLNTITTAMGSGRPAGMAAAIAVGLGTGLWCLGMSLGIAALFQVVPIAQSVLTLMAAGLLIYFATRYLRAALSASYREASLRARGGLTPRASFWRSLSIVGTNPKALTTWLAILGIVPVAEAGLVEIAILTSGAAMISGGIHMVYVFIFSAPAAARVYLRAAPVINGAVGLFFASFAVKLIVPLLGHL